MSVADLPLLVCSPPDVYSMLRSPSFLSERASACTCDANARVLRPIRAFDGRERDDLVIRCSSEPDGCISSRRGLFCAASSNPVSEFACGHILLKLLLHRRHSRLPRLGPAAHAESTELSRLVMCE